MSLRVDSLKERLEQGPLAKLYHMGKEQLHLVEQTIKTHTNQFFMDGPIKLKIITS